MQAPHDVTITVCLEWGPLKDGSPVVTKWSTEDCRPPGRLQLQSQTSVHRLSMEQGTKMAATWLESLPLFMECLG